MAHGIEYGVVVDLHRLADEPRGSEFPGEALELPRFTVTGHELYTGAITGETRVRVTLRRPGSAGDTAISLHVAPGDLEEFPFLALGRAWRLAPLDR